MGGSSREDGACENPLRRVDSNTRSPREPSRLPSASALSIQQGGFVAAIEASAPFNASRKRPFPSFGSGPGEARCDDVRVYTVTCGCVRCQTEASANVRHSANTIASSTPASPPTGLALSTTKTRLPHLRVSEPKPETRHPANNGLVALPRKFAEMFAADYGIRRLAGCGQTLKWRPRTWEAERLRCLHPTRSTRRSEYLKADFHKTPWNNSVEEELNQIELYDLRRASPKFG